MHRNLLCSDAYDPLKRHAQNSPDAFDIPIKAEALPRVEDRPITFARAAANPNNFVREEIHKCHICSPSQQITTFRKKLSN